MTNLGLALGPGPAQGARRGRGRRPGALQPHHRRAHVHEDEDAGIPQGLTQPDAGPLRLRSLGSSDAAGRFTPPRQAQGIRKCAKWQHAHVELRAGDTRIQLRHADINQPALHTGFA